VVDNLRYDQWKTFESEVSNYYKLEKKSLFILPTATQYARNAIFSGLTPLEMEKPQYWKNDPEEGGKTYMKLSFISATKTPRTEHQRRLF
jgi:hypothetical protein